MTTKTFLAQFGFESLRDLPDIEMLEDAGLLAKDQLLAGAFPGGCAAADDGDETAIGPRQRPNPVGIRPLSTRRLPDVSRSASPRKVRSASNPPGVRRSASAAARGAFAVPRMRELKHRKKTALGFLVLGQKSGAIVERT